MKVRGARVKHASVGGHWDGGLLKTRIVVTFDEGETFAFDASFLRDCANALGAECYSVVRYKGEVERIKTPEDVT